MGVRWRWVARAGHARTCPETFRKSPRSAQRSATAEPARHAARRRAIGAGADGAGRDAPCAARRPGREPAFRSDVAKRRAGPADQERRQGLHHRAQPQHQRQRLRNGRCREIRQVAWTALPGIAGALEQGRRTQDRRRHAEAQARKGAAKTRVVEQEDEDSDEDDEEEEDSYAHFTSGEKADIEFNGGGALVNPETGKTASATKRKAIYRGLGIGEHLLRGHFLDEETLKSQNAAESADGASGNFSWASDKAALDTVEAGRRAFEDKKASTKKIDVAIAEDAGFGFVTGTDGQRYKVFPRKARVIRKAKGDFKTAYGVTEEKDPAKFDAAYHRTEAVA
ncbi:MAG: hypothetical protein WDN03_18540 [Rhizomicrobium sp.]